MPIKLLFALLLLSSFQVFANWTEKEISSELKTLLYTPETSAPNKPRALIVHLHGCAQSAQTLKDHANWEAVAQEKNLIVALPSVPGGGVYAGCWDYYGSDHQRDNRHNQHLLELVSALKEQKELNIDGQKVFITGLSSGAGQAMVLACLAPDIFSGAGLVATPTVGSSVSEISRPKLTAQQSLKVCLDLAGIHKDKIKEQKISIVTAPNDHIVGREHGVMIKEIYQLLLQTKSSQSFELSTYPGQSPKGSVEIFRDSEKAPLSFIEHQGLGHNWPSGQGGRTSGFVFKQGLNYPAYLSSFLLDEEAKN